MEEGTRQSGGSYFLINVAAFIIVVAGMRAAETILIPFLLALFFAIICASPLFWLQKKGIPSWLSMLIVVAGIVGIGIVISELIGPSLSDFSKDLPAYQTRLKQKTGEFLTWLGNKGVKISDQQMQEIINPAAAMNLAADMLKGFRGVLTNALLIFLTVVFILLEASSFSAKLHAALGDPLNSLSRLKQFTANVKRYVAIKTLASLATAAAITIWLVIIGLDYPLLWGLLVFFLNYVPNIGSIIAAVPAILLALIQLGPGSALWVCVAYLVVNGIMGSVIEPRFMGRGLGLSTLVVFISLVFWGWVLGPVGMFLSIPLTMTVKIALDSNRQTRWMAIMLGSEAAAQADLPAVSKNSNDGPHKTEPSKNSSDQNSPPKGDQDPVAEE